MNVQIERVEKDAWEKQMAVHAHRACFEETMPPDFERIDYALLAIDLDQTLAIAYMTVRELDRDTAYMKHGGAFDPIRGGNFTLPTYLKFLDRLKETYLCITTLIENTNVTYLKFALKAGFRVTGIRYFQGAILLELNWEKN